MGVNSINRYVIGIDEVGRGPLAGPVTVCAVLMSQKEYNEGKFFKGIRDSKKLSEKKRLLWRERASVWEKQGILRYALVSKTAQDIDERGIAVAIHEALGDCLEQLVQMSGVAPARMSVYLDGSLRAPAHFKHQETIIKGDEKVPLISIASIIAKVDRDRYMEEMAAVHPGYGFKENKGYGTAAHRKALSEKGPTKLHRRSFLGRILSF